MSGNDKSGAEYPTKTRQLVKSIFMEHRSIPATIRELKRRGYIAPDKKTIARWRRQENWDEQLDMRDKIDEPDYSSELDKLETLIRKQEGMLKIAQAQLVGKDKQGNIKILSSDSQKLYAWNRLSETLAKLYESQRRIEKEAAGNTPVEVIFSALMKHPILGKHLSKASVRSEVQDLIAEEMMQLQRKAVGL